MFLSNSFFNATTVDETPFDQENLYQEIIKEKRDVVSKNKLKLEESLASSSGVLLTPERKEILALRVHELLGKLRDGEVTALDVLQAYQAKAVEVTKNINCVTVFIHDAEDWAKTLDGLPEEQRRRLPLFGLPISVKDNIDVEGHDSTLGLAKRVHKPAKDNAVLVQTVRALGGVPFCKTNVPQTLLSYGCSNPVWGKTGHPLDNQRTPGGSSGGEGALIGAGGSLVGLGTDVGGSVRIPAVFCGCVGFKPTGGRLSKLGVRACLTGLTGVTSTPGIMSRDVEGLVLLMRNLLDGDSNMYRLDQGMAPISWRSAIFHQDRKLRIGWYDDDGFITPTPGCRRAVAVARDALEAAGHELVPFKPHDIATGWKLSVGCFSADQGQTILQMWENEEVDLSVANNKSLMAAPSFIKKVLRPIVRMKSQFLADLMSTDTASSHGLWDTLSRRQEYLQEWCARWAAQGLDVVLAPGSITPPLPHDYPTKIMPAGYTTFLYNLLDFPVGAVPVTTESEEDQALLQEYPTHDQVLRDIKQGSTGALGLPLGVQVVGLPWKDELVCHTMQKLQDALCRSRPEVA